jgi:hypothetical protein
VDPAIRAARNRAARHELWRQGEIWRIYFDRNQLADHHKLWSRPTEDFVLDVSRQTGKSWFMLVQANCFAIQHPGSRIPYASLTQKSIAEIVEPAMARLIDDAPKDAAPRHDRQRNAWEWPVGRGSYMIAAGTDNKHYTSLRGPAAHLIIKDEEGFFEDPMEVDAVLSPQTVTTGGITISGSTPPVSPGHPWTKRCEVMKAAGRYVHRTIWDHGRLTRAQVEQFLRREALKYGQSYEEFLNSTTYKREYLAQHIIDASRAVVPMWTDAADALVKEIPRPRWFYPTVGLDFGFRDGLAATFGYWHYGMAANVVEDEVLLFGKADDRMLEKFANAIRAKLRELWPATMPKPYTEATRTAWGSWAPFGLWGDNDLLVINELGANYGLNIQPTRKDDKELQLNEMNRLVNSRRFYVHPRCKNLRTQLATTIWNKQRTSYERDSNGHGDVLDAELYRFRNLPRNANPEPPFWDADPRKQWIPEHDEKSEDEQALSGAFS